MFSTYLDYYHLILKVCPSLTFMAPPPLFALQSFPSLHVSFAHASFSASLLNGGVSQGSMLGIFIFSGFHTFLLDGLFQDFSGHFTDVPETCISTAGLFLDPQTSACSLFLGFLLYRDMGNTVETLKGCLIQGTISRMEVKLFLTYMYVGDAFLLYFL